MAKFDKNLYINYKDYSNDIKNTEEKINKELIQYQKNIDNGLLAIDLEKKITELLKHHKDIYKQLEFAYQDRNVPAQIPNSIIDQRQKEIQIFGFNYNGLENQFKKIKNSKYGFKKNTIEDYNKSNYYGDYKTLNSKEFISLEKNKLNKLNEEKNTLEDILLDTKRSVEILKKTLNQVKENKNYISKENIEDEDKDEDEDLEKKEEKIKINVTRKKSKNKNFFNTSYWFIFIYILIKLFIIGIVVFVLSLH